MSGCFISTGKKTNNGEHLLNIDDLLNTKILSLVIHCVPLSNDLMTRIARARGKHLQLFIHPALSFTLSHIAIQLNMENEDILIIEYGQYLTQESEIKKGLFCSGSSGSSAEPRTDSNGNLYYYINKDGARLTKIDQKKYFSNSQKTNELISDIIAAENLHMSYEELIQKGIKKKFEFYNIECDVKNKITLKELINNFQNENWEAKKYNLLAHNCQTFGAEVITILKAVRINERDKIRTKEKMILPNCIIKALWKNEDLSVVNTLGRIPILGLGFDAFSGIFVRNKKK